MRAVSLLALLPALALASPAQRAVPTTPPLAPGVLNSLGKGQDPAPLTLNGTGGNNTYLFPDVDFEKKVWLRVSDNLNTIQSNVTVNNHTIFEFDTNIQTEAPDISHYQDRYALYISAVVINLIYVIASDTSDYLGSYSAHGVVMRPDGLAPLEGYDAHVIVHPNGKRYLAWSTSYHSYPSISLVELDGLNTTTGDIVPILLPTEPYEMTGKPSGDFGNQPVLEAPSSWVFGDTLNLAYAANTYDDHTYATILATASIHDDPLNQSSWTKAPWNPILQTDASQQVYGPGSGGFFVGPDGDPWFAYGAFSDPAGFVNKTNIRTVRAQKVEADSVGRILPFTPVKAKRYVPDNEGWKR